MGSVELPQCPRHPETRATIVCARCGTFACESCRTAGHDGRDYCAACAALLPPPLATAGARFSANFIDSAAFGLPFLAGIALGAMFPEGSWVSRGSGLLTACAVLVVLAIQLVLSARHGQSIGKRLLKIRVVRLDGSRASLLRIVFLRNAIPLMISNVPFGGFLFGLVDSLMIFGAPRRCVHDYMADTIVVEALWHQG